MARPTLAEGIDVSGWQRNVDWDRVRDSGHSFAYSKLTEGTSTNRRWYTRAKGALKAGLDVGAYHFARPDTWRRRGLCDARSEARTFLDYHIRLGFTLVPALDLEAGIDEDERYNVEWAREWLYVVERSLGCRCLVYTGRWAIQRYYDEARPEDLKALAQRPLWWAEYSDEKVEPTKDTSPWSPDQIAIWQWSGSHRVPGVRGKCDANRLLVPIETLRLGAEPC